MATRFYVTTPIYYINDVPHLGTAYTTIAADVLARYHRLRGHDTWFLTGTDEHGLKIERAAKERGQDPRSFADEMSAPFRQAWQKLGCSFDDFIRTTEERHESKVAELWKKVHEKGDLYLDAYEGWYCVGCEAYYTEKELGPDNTCPIHNRAVERVREPSYFFRLSKYQDKLLEFYEQNPGFVQPAGRFNEVKAFVRGGLEDLSVSRTSFSWGVPVPGDPKHVMYVWFDALANYWTAVDTPELSRFWPANLHIVGKDILRFHAVYWPAFLMSAGLPLPEKIFAHGWMTVNGQKMSKSLRNTVSPLKLAEAFGVDPVRYYLMAAISFGQDGDFNLKDLVTRYNAELGNSLGNLANRVLSQCKKHFDGKVPPKSPKGDEEPERKLRALFEDLSAKAASEMDALSPTRAIAHIFAFIGGANVYIDEAAPWAAAKRGDTERLGHILATAVEALEAISLLVSPFMPGKADELRKQLGLGPVTPVVDKDQYPKALPVRAAGEPLGEVTALFPRIDAEKEAAIFASLGFAETPAQEPKPEAKAEPKAEAKPAAEAAQEVATITYDDFAKVDLRVGHIVAAEKVQGKDKLLALKVDLGEAEPRSIIAGLALSFAPESLVGRRVLVVANLAPRKFGKGMVSHGMILAAGPSENLRLPTVPDDVPPGTKVK